MLPLFVAAFCLLVGKGVAQNDFSDPIRCYTCTGAAENSSCADPIDVEHKDVKQKQCDRGICLKWTKYQGRELQMMRECSIDLNFHLTMIDGVCRTERNDNGWLCMCGKHLCNRASMLLDHGQQNLVAGLVAASISLLCLSWNRRVEQRW